MGFPQAAWSLIFEIYLDKMKQETLEEGDLHGQEAGKIKFGRTPQTKTKRG